LNVAAATVLLISEAVAGRSLNMLTLYYAPNTCALASHIALEEAGA
jgi:hypothetical protein